MAERYIPNMPEISREALAVIAGAVIAAVFFGYIAPDLGRWVAARLPTASKPTA